MGKKLTKPKRIITHQSSNIIPSISQSFTISTSDPIILHPKSCKKFPSDVLKWMKANAKPSMALKLMKVCKYFQHKEFPYKPIKGLSKKEGGAWNYCTHFGNAFGAAETIENIYDKKLLITQYLYLHQIIDPFSSLLEKIAICQAKTLHLDFQNITFEEFKTLTAAGTIEKAKICNTLITEEKDKSKLAALEKILACLPKVKELFM